MDALSFATAQQQYDEDYPEWYDEDEDDPYEGYDYDDWLADQADRTIAERKEWVEWPE